MILPHRANPRGCDFRERQGRFVANSLGGQARDTMPKPYNARTRVVQKPTINICLSG
jgi:hypothetical protein